MVRPSATAITPPSIDEKEIGVLPLDFLLAHVNKANPKDHDLGEIIQSIVRHGFVGFVTLDSTSNLLVAGHGRVMALAAMRDDGYEPPARIGESGEGDWLVPTYTKAFVSEHERNAYLIGDNQTVILGGWMDDQLIDMLTSLHEEDPQDGMKGTGFDASDLQALIDARDFEEPPPEAPSELQTRYGISVTVTDKTQENRVSDLLIAHGFSSFQRYSEG